MTRFLAAGVCVPHPCDPTQVGATSRRSSDARADHTATAPHSGCGVALLSTQSRSCVQGITGDRDTETGAA